jgi:hypothetical protein
VFLTSVTKFFQACVFSDLSNLTDTSLNPDFYDLCGIPQEEPEVNFQFESEIDQTAREKNIDKTGYPAKIKAIL